MSTAHPQSLAHAIRFLSIDAIVRATEGHQGVPLGMAEIATALFTRHLKYNPADPTWPDRDRFVLSNGHGSMLLYSLLYLTGYGKITLDEIKRFRELGSHCAGHPEFDPSAGIEVTTGPLGQGIANAFGMAVAEAYLNARFGAGLIDHYTYAFVGDGCLQVVSIPCWELFDRQPENYRSAVLGPDTVRIAIEAAVRFGWDRYLGSRGGFVGMSGFGASGPADELFRRFGITPKAVVAEVLRRCEAIH